MKTNQKRRKYFHGYTAHVLMSYRLGGVFFNLLPAVAVGCLQKQPSHTFIRIQMSVPCEPWLHLLGMLGQGLGHQEKGPCEPLSAIREGKAPPWQLPSPQWEDEGASNLGT